MSALITEIKPYGLVCKIEGEPRKALIRFWDWDWRESLTFEDAQSRASEFVRRRVTCRIRDYEKYYDQLLLSPREANARDWEQAVRDLTPRASDVAGEVIGFQAPDVYFIRLDSGIVGQTLSTEFPHLPGAMSQGLLLGDRVRAEVESIDSERHEVRLSVSRAVAKKRRRLLGRSHAQSSLDAGPAWEPTDVDAPLSVAEPPQEAPGETPAHATVGWVEDHPELTEPLRELLRRRGARVELLPTDPPRFIQALRRLGEQLDLVVIDIDLGPESSGVELARGALQERLFLASQIVFFTGVVQATLLRDARDLDPKDILAKGIDDDSLLRYVEGRAPVRPRFSVVEEAEFFDSSGDAPFREPDYEKETPEREIEASLSALVEDLGAESAFLVGFKRGAEFSLDGEFSRRDAGGSARHLAPLRHTPVMDVIRSGKPYSDLNCFDNPKRHEHLFRVLGPSASLRILPVAPFGATTHALILMGGSVSGSAFLNEVAGHLRCAIENAHMWELSQQLNRAAETGMLAVGVVHDLKGHATRINGCSRLIKEILRSAEQRGATPTHDETEKLRFASVSLEHGARELLRPILRLLDKVRGKEPDQLDLAQAVLRTVSNIRSLEETKEARVSVKVDAQEYVGRILGSSLKLEQILFNLLLNAVQQIRLADDPMGEITVISRVNAGNDGRRYLTITVKDTGPGIHRCDFERIFDFGVTTRPAGEGTGIGLFQTRQLARSLGAVVRVAASTLFFGSEFTVTLQGD